MKYDERERERERERAFLTLSFSNVNEELGTTIYY
jgi:hypothetical protein